MTSATSTAQAILDALQCGNPRCACHASARRGRGKVHCVAHPDPGPSLNVTPTSDGGVLLHCFAGCAQDEVIAALRDRGLWGEPKRPQPNGQHPPLAYTYRDGAGRIVGRVVRQPGKRFFQERYDDGEFRPGLAGQSLPLYRLPDVVNAPAGATVCVVEGEKDADRLASLGLVATTNAGGAGKFRPDHAECLRDRHVIVLPDNDEPGRKHAEDVVRLCRGIAASVRVLHLPGLPAKGDVSDWLDAGHSVDELLALAEALRSAPMGHDAEPEPLADPPPLAELLDTVAAFVSRYVVLTEHQSATLSLWTAHTHAFAAADQTPYLAVSSAEKRSGKTRLLEALSLLVARPWFTGRTTAAALVRKVDAVTPTLLLDEADPAFRGDQEYSETLRGVLNSGHRRGGSYTVCVGQGANLTFKDFSTFAPKAIAGIGKLPDTVRDRSIPIELKRKARTETVERFRQRDAAQQAKPIADGLRAWATTATEELTDARPAIPDALDDRAADGWEPLLAIADLAGGDWPKRAREAALALSAGEAREDDSLGVRLLSDLHELFVDEDVDRLTTSTILRALNAREESPWGGFHDGAGMKARDLANILRRFNVKPRTIRFDDGTAKGYKQDDFEDAWSRYLTPDPADKRNIRNIRENIAKTAPEHPSQTPPVLRMKMPGFLDSGADVTPVTDTAGDTRYCAQCGVKLLPAEAPAGLCWPCLEPSACPV